MPPGGRKCKEYRIWDRNGRHSSKKMRLQICILFLNFPPNSVLLIKCTHNYQLVSTQQIWWLYFSLTIQDIVSWKILKIISFGQNGNGVFFFSSFFHTKIKFYQKILLKKHQKIFRSRFILYYVFLSTFCRGFLLVSYYTSNFWPAILLQFGEGMNNEYSRYFGYINPPSPECWLSPPDILVRRPSKNSLPLGNTPSPSYTSKINCIPENLICHPLLSEYTGYISAMYATDAADIEICIWC